MRMYVALLLLELLAYNASVQASHAASGSRLLRGVPQQSPPPASSTPSTSRQALGGVNNGSVAGTGNFTQPQTEQKPKTPGSSTIRAVIGLLGHSVAPVQTNPMQQQQLPTARAAPVPGPTAEVGILATGVSSGPSLSKPVSSPDDKQDQASPIKWTNDPASNAGITNKATGPHDTKPTAPQVAGGAPYTTTRAMPPSRHLLQQHRRPHPLAAVHRAQVQQRHSRRQLRSVGATTSLTRSGPLLHAAVHWPPI